MAITWVVIADRSRCKIVQLQGMRTAATIVTDVLNPEGRLPLHEIDTDAATFTSHSGDGVLHDGTHREHEIDHLVRRFAGEMADAIEIARVRRRFDHLALICAPSFLGALRDALPQACRRLLVCEIAKNIVDMDERLMLARAKEDVAEALRFLSL